MFEKCPKCGRMHYATDPCAAPQLERVSPLSAVETSISIPAARSNTLKPRPERNAYLAEYMRTVYRPRVKARKVNAGNSQVNDG